MTRRNIVGQALSLAMLLAMALPAKADDVIGWKFDVAMARHLVVLAYDGGKATDGSLEFSPGMSDPFLVFDGLGPVVGSYGYFAVNPWTGDVWNLWGCHRLMTADLRKTMTDIRASFSKVELEQYHDLRLAQPDCIVSDSSIGPKIATGIAKKLDASEAQTLAAAAVENSDDNPSDYYFQADMSHRDFLAFDGLSRPANRDYDGFYTVNPWTGAVWNLALCRKLSTPMLRDMQEDIIGRFNADERREYLALDHIRPRCLYDERHEEDDSDDDKD